MGGALSVNLLSEFDYLIARYLGLLWCYRNIHTSLSKQDPNVGFGPEAAMSAMRDKAAVAGDLTSVSFQFYCREIDFNPRSNAAPIMKLPPIRSIQTRALSFNRLTSQLDPRP